jgi:hypothetical protein
VRVVQIGHHCLNLGTSRTNEIKGRSSNPTNY